MAAAISNPPVPFTAPKKAQIHLQREGVAFFYATILLRILAAL
jgi:hypothetical protein